MRRESVGEWGIVSTMLSVACASRTRAGAAPSLSNFLVSNKI